MNHEWVDITVNAPSDLKPATWCHSIDAVNCFRQCQSHFLALPGKFLKVLGLYEVRFRATLGAYGVNHLMLLITA
jgi:hypothetical protein